MPASGSQFAGKLAALGKHLFKGLYVRKEGLGYAENDACQVQITTGTTALPDIPATAGTYTLLAAGELPSGFGLDITSLAVDQQGATAWTGGTGTTKSIILQDSSGTEICSFTQNFLAGNVQASLPNASPPTGVSDTSVKKIGASVAAGLGLQAVVQNTPSAGSPLRIRLNGYLMS